MTAFGCHKAPAPGRLARRFPAFPRVWAEHPLGGSPLLDALAVLPARPRVR